MYRSDMVAAQARNEVLLRKNERLMQENAELRQESAELRQAMSSSAQHQQLHLRQNRLWKLRISLGTIFYVSVIVASFFMVSTRGCQ